MKELTNLVLRDENSAEIVGLLLRNTLELLPSLQTAPTPQSDRDQDFGDDRRGDDRRGSGRGGDDNRGNGRGNRGDRGGEDRGNRGGRGQERRQPRSGDDQGFNDERRGNGGNANDEFGQPGNSRGDGNRGFREDRGERGGDEEFPRNREPRNYVPPEKHARVYLGHGTTHGLTSEKLHEILSQQCNVQADAVKRAQVRTNYSFFDISDEAADAAVTALAEIQFGPEKFFARKAATISVPRPQNAQGGEEDGQGGQQQMDSDSEQQPQMEESQDSI